MVMRIAIVGGTGTLGQHVAAELGQRGHEVRVLSRRSEYPVDLTTGAGLDQALTGCAVVVDASNNQSAKRARAVLVDGSQRLLSAEQKAGVGHHVCVSIVGCDQVPMGYYKVKVDQEKVIEAASVPWSIVQATQFHELAASALAAAGKYRLLPVPRLALQTIAAAEVAGAVADVAEGSPLRRRLRVAGPTVSTARDLALTWRRITGRRAVLVPLPVPGRLGRTLRAGGLTAPEADVKGTLTFASWLSAQSASDRQRAPAGS
jgi:uncharacterized protein YbjT (DUF2867 family)